MSTSETPPTLFATTRWTLVCAAAWGGDASAVDALGSLFQTYWRPLYRYARRKGQSQHDAEDLVQGFMANLIEARALQKTDRNRGRFRAFLLASFNHWMINDWKKSSREKRGGGVADLSFDWECAESGLKLDVPDDRSPDRLYDREWALTLLAKVLNDLEEICRAEGMGKHFAALKPCLTVDSKKISYVEISTMLGISEGAARVAVHRLRKKYRELLTGEIARTLAVPDALDDEMRSLFAALA